jgi:small subunit ribosomal protein S6
MRQYETIIIAKPQLSDEQVNELVEKSKKVITENGGELLAEDRWGRRKLSYPIMKAREGVYAYLKFKAGSPALEKLSHHFKVIDTVLRATTVLALRPQKPRKKATGPKPVSASPAAASHAPHASHSSHS